MDEVRQSLIDELRKYVKPGDTLYTVLRHVSRSGLRRDISIVYALHSAASGRTRIVCLDHLVAYVLNRRTGKAGGIRCQGVGEDAGFRLVYELGRVLYPSWPCLGPGCPSSEHTPGDRGYEGRTHADGGYSLRHSWL